MEFQAENKNGQLTIKPIIEKQGNNVIIHVPSLNLIAEFKEKNK